MRRLICVFGLLVIAAASVSSQQQPPRDPSAPLTEGARRERDLQARVASEGLTVRLALELAQVQEEGGAYDRAEATLLAARKVFPNDARLAVVLGGFYNRLGMFPQTVQMLEEAAALQPNDPIGYYTVATYYEEKVRKDFRVSAEDQLTYILKGIEASDRALAINPDYPEALVYKNILLRHQMRHEPDRGRQAILEQQADQLRARAMELNRLRTPSGTSVERSLGGPPPPPPPPSRAPCNENTFLATPSAVRVGGTIKAPTKTKDVRPAYPPEAQMARIQGVVIIEATIAEDGTVVGACVLRSIPHLDDAAVEAVRQWQFTPTLLNGMPVPVKMTVTVNFELE